MRSLSLLALFAIGCTAETPAPAAPQEPAPIVIGSVLALSGENQSFGITQRNGMDIALAEINAAGGINGHPLEIKYADSQLDVDRGEQEYKRLTSAEGVRAIVGMTGSGVALRVAPLAEKDQVVILDSIDTSPKLTAEGGNYFFRNIASDAYGGQVLSTWAVEKGHTTAALVYNSESDWAMGCKSAVEEAYPKSGGTFSLAPLAVVEATTDFGGPAAAVKASKPGAVFVCLMGRQAGLFAQQATASGLAGPFFGTDPFSQQEFIDNVGGAAEHVLFALPASSQNPRYDAFSAEYKKRYNADADAIAAKAYDALHVMAEALRTAEAKGATSGPPLRDALAGTTYAGITGENAFDATGDLKTAAFDRFTYSKDKVRTSAP